MYNTDHQTSGKHIDFLSHFPKHIHPVMHDTQRSALLQAEMTKGSIIEEMPTGSGKTAYAFTLLRGLRAKYGDGAYFYVTPNKTQVDQIKNLYPEFHVVYGRNEYDCLYYENPSYKADEIPCSLLSTCPHRVNQQNGETFEPGAHRCPYLDAKWEAKQSTLVVCTLSFYLFTTLFSKEWGEIKGVVVDEAHQMSDIIRNALSYEITDYHLNGIVDFLKKSKIEEWQTFELFLGQMITAVKNHHQQNPLLDDNEIRLFINTLGSINRGVIETELKKVLAKMPIESREELEFIKKLEMIIRDLHRYMKSFEYSLDRDDGKKALNYTYAYLKIRKTEREKSEYVLNVKCYYVIPIIRKIFPEDKTYFMSATIGNIDAFRMDTGLKNHSFFSHKSEFPVENTRIYIPTDIDDLSKNKSKRNSKSKTMRRIAVACKKFADAGHRSLVLVVSDEERQRFLTIAKEEKLNVITYSDKMKPKACVAEFKKGMGDALVGTMAQYGEGIDLPNQTAPIIWALRPAYAPPNDPKALYEEKRFKNARWVLWNSKEMNRILQIRGRNVRSISDKGVTFCMSQQYKKIVLRSLPNWLQKAYVYTKTFEEAVDDAIALLNK